MFQKLVVTVGPALALAAILSAGPLRAQSSGPFTVAETGERFADLQDAVGAIGGGTGTIRIAPGRYGGCAVQEAGRIAFVAETPGTVIFDGGICEDKAILVLRGRSARVEGLTLLPLALLGFFLYACHINLLSLDHSF